jgi:hypothetical protein
MADESSVNVQLADELITILLCTWRVERLITYLKLFIQLDRV